MAPSHSHGLPWLRSPCKGKQELFFRVQTSWLLIREEAYWTSSSAFSSQWNWKKKYLLSAQLCRWNLKRFRARKEWAQDDSRRNLFLHFSMISLHFCRAGRQQIGCVKWNLYRQERQQTSPIPYDYCILAFSCLSISFNVTSAGKKKKRNGL